MRIFDQEINAQFIHESYAVSLTTVVIMIMLEILTWDEQWSQKWKKARIRNLYFEAVMSNVLHYFVIGPLGYGMASAFISWAGNCNSSYISIPGSILLQGLGYTVAHAWMHIPSNYWMHKYHHRYNEHTFVRPIVANSVSMAEFAVAYVLTNMVAAMVFCPSVSDMYYIIMTISISNLLIHTSPDVIPMRFLPSFLCSNEKHGHHHKKNIRSHYSAPVFDLDSSCEYLARQIYKVNI